MSTEAPKIDAETQKELDKNSALLELTGHHGWKVARKLIEESILNLQNVAEYADTIQTGNATKLLKEMKANIRVAEILFSWLTLIEGGAQTAIENRPLKKSSTIVRLDDENNVIE